MTGQNKIYSKLIRTLDECGFTILDIKQEEYAEDIQNRIVRRCPTGAFLLRIKPNPKPESKEKGIIT